MTSCFECLDFQAVAVPLAIHVIPRASANCADSQQTISCIHVIRSQTSSKLESSSKDPTIVNELRLVCTPVTPLANQLEAR